MTISSTTRIAGPYIGNGTATVFAFTFKVFAAADLDVVRLNTSNGAEAVLVLNSDYSVTLNGDQNSNPGGSITLLAGALATGFKLTITSDIANLQPTDLTNQGGFYPEVITDSFDRSTIQIQQMSEDVGRSLKAPLSDGTPDMELPTAAQRANSFLAFDANGTPFTVPSSSTGSPVGSTSAALVSYTQGSSGSITTNVQAKLRESVSVKDFGAVGDGATDDTAAINAALASGAKCVHFPSGTYKIYATIVVPANVSITGDGTSASIIDGSSATFASLTNGTLISVTGGSWTALPALTSNPVAGASSLVFGSAPSVSRGDVVVIYNPTNGSWSNFRTYYRAGEMQRIAAVAGNTATIQGSLFHGYTAANVNAYVLTAPTTAMFRDFALKGLADTGNAVFGIRLTKGVDCVFDNIKVTDCSYAGLSLFQCFNTSVINCSVQEDAASSFGGDYGLLVSNCMSLTATGGYYYAARHAITTGGSDEIGSVPNRLVKYSALTAATGSTTTVGALDFHGNCEHCSVDGCTVDGGLRIGGDHLSVDSCIIFGKGESQSLVAADEMRGTSMSFTGNVMRSYYQGSGGRAAFFDFGGGSLCITGDTVVGGILSFTNNNLDWKTTLTNGTPWLFIANRGYTGNDISVVIDSNAIASDGLGGMASVRGFSTAAKFDSVSVQNNVVRNCGLLNIDHDASGSFAATDVIVQNNIVINATSSAAYGIYAQDVSDTVTIVGNTIRDCNNFAIASIAPTAGVTTTVCIMDNVVVDGLKTSTGSTTTNADIIVWRATNAVCANNFFGSFDADRSYGLSFNTITSLMARDNTAWQTTNTSTYANVVSGYLPGAILSGSATYDPPNLLDGAGATTTVTVTGAALGDLVECVSFSLDLQGITVTGYVSAANTVSVRFQNESGGTLDLGSGTLLVRVRKA